MNRRNKKYLFVLVLLLLCTLASAVLISSAQQEKEFKTLKVALNSRPATVDPADHRQRNAQTLVRNWTDGLTQTLPDGSHVLDLATSITLIDDVTYEVKLKEGVTFHNGDLMTADDVIFSLTRLGMEGGMEGETSPRRPLVGPIKSLEKIDDYTLLVNLESPNIELQARNWFNVEIMPKKYFEEVGIEGFLKHPIGVGPFKWVGGSITDQVILERYENYHGGPAELPGEVDRIPAVDRVIFNFISEDTTR